MPPTENQQAVDIVLAEYWSASAPGGEWASEAPSEVGWYWAVGEFYGRGSHVLPCLVTWAGSGDDRHLLYIVNGGSCWYPNHPDPLIFWWQRMTPPTPVLPKEDRCTR